MFKDLEEIWNKGIYVIMIACIIYIFLIGLFFGFTYYVMDTTHNALLATDCVIENNTLVGSCQDLWSLALYPFLALKTILVWVSYFAIFGLVLAILLVGYRSGSSPTGLGIMFIFTGGATYLGLLLSNAYRSLLTNEIAYNIMVPFTVYNKIMLYFPWFCFVVCLMGFVLGVINFQATPVNKASNLDELNY